MEQDFLFCLGTGGCGFRSFFEILLQNGDIVNRVCYKGNRCKYQNSGGLFNSSKDLIWNAATLSDEERKERVINFLREIFSNSNQVVNLNSKYVCEISHYTLPYVETIMSLLPNSKFICLKGEKEKTINSLWKQWAYRNPLTKRKDSRYAVQQFPDFSYLDCKPAISKFYDEYYGQCEFLSKNYPANFLLVDAKSFFSSAIYQSKILKSLGMKNIKVFHSQKEIYTTALHGGLANNLFQMCEAVAFAKENGLETPSFASWNKSEKIPFYYQPDDFLGRHNGKHQELVDTFPNLEWLEDKDVNCNVSFAMNDMFKFKTVHHMRKEIIEYFKISEKTKGYLTKKYSRLSEKNTTSIHLRFGDLAADDAPPQGWPLISYDFYFEIIQKMPAEEVFYICSDIISRGHHFLYEATKKFPDRKGNFVLVDDNAFKTLALMSMCRNHVLYHSTFSFWGAYLDQKQEGKTIFPDTFDNRICWLFDMSFLEKSLNWEKMKAPTINYRDRVPNRENYV